MTEKDLTIERETLYNRCRNAGNPTEEDRVELRKLLGNEALQRALFYCLTESDVQGHILLGVNLGDSAGMASAIKMQGISHGLIRAVDILFEQAYMESKETEDENEI